MWSVVKTQSVEFLFLFFKRSIIFWKKKTLKFTLTMNVCFEKQDMKFTIREKPSYESEPEKG